MAKKIFITGTCTDIGKTFAAGLIVKKLHESGRNSAYFKAAMSGNTRQSDGTLVPGDAKYVRDISGINQPLEQMCPYVYETAVSPHLASRIEGNAVEMQTVKERFMSVCEKYDYVTVEGSGGIMCPISFDREKIWLEDIIKELNLSCIIVADAGLGTINHVALTVEYMQRRGIKIKGLIFNRFHPGDLMEEDNIKMCEYVTGLKTISCIQDGSSDLNIDADKLAALYD